MPAAIVLARRLDERAAVRERTAARVAFVVRLRADRADRDELEHRRRRGGRKSEYPGQLSVSGDKVMRYLILIGSGAGVGAVFWLAAAREDLDDDHPAATPSRTCTRQHARLVGFCCGPGYLWLFWARWHAKQIAGACDIGRTVACIGE